MISVITTWQLLKNVTDDYKIILIRILTKKSNKFNKKFLKI